MLKSQKDILQKLGIEALNQMQLDSFEAISNHNEVVLLSPTGTGKTLAFILPIISKLEEVHDQTQILILTPSRELAIQIEQVVREIGSGFKVNAIYGGRTISKDFLELNRAPSILVGTPGRIADHFRRETIDVRTIHTLVLDEFDKSLEIGFEKDMKEIVEALPNVKQKILTSATDATEIPYFLRLKNLQRLDYLSEKTNDLAIKIVESTDKDKLEALVRLLLFCEGGNGIVFCNFKNSIQFVSDHLSNNSIHHGCFYGGLEQYDRERALIKFRNGTDTILLATDLAARGIDVPDLDFIVHYQLPIGETEFTHRNGRTARMKKGGTAYVLKWEEEDLHDFIQGESIVIPTKDKGMRLSEWKTIFISGGRKDKISKGDIAGFFMKMGKLEKDELGTIELKQDCAFVSVPVHKANMLLETLNNQRLKKKKVRLTMLD